VGGAAPGRDVRPRGDDVRGQGGVERHAPPPADHRADRQHNEGHRGGAGRVSADLDGDEGLPGREAEAAHGPLPGCAGHEQEEPHGHTCLRPADQPRQSPAKCAPGTAGGGAVEAPGASRRPADADGLERAGIPTPTWTFGITASDTVSLRASATAAAGSRWGDSGAASSR